MSEQTEQKESKSEELSEQLSNEVEEKNEKQAENENNNEDNVEKTEDTEQAENNEPSKEELIKENEQLKAQLEQAEDRYLRLRADFDNMRRRHQLEIESIEKYRAQKLLTQLLPVIDNLERALQVEVTSDDAKSLYKGIDMVYKSFIEATKQEGLEVIPAEGQPFDPNVHQAVMQESDAEKESGIVLKELQKGYKLKDRVIRPSMVSVNE